MISGLIVYSKDDTNKNAWFISKCQEECQKEHISLIYKEENEVLEYINNHHVDFIINRSRNSQLVKISEKRGIRCFNRSLVSQIANDKYATYLFLKKQQFPVLKTSLDIKDFNQYPLVMKSLNGHGGNEVYLINSESDIDKITSKTSKKFLYQEYLPNEGDLRVYVLNQQVIGAVKRSNQKDFRSNYSLGGEVVFINPKQEIINAALKISRLLNADYIGIDFLITENAFFVSEIEDPVGARMLYQTSSIDIIKLFITHIVNEIKNI